QDSGLDSVPYGGKLTVGATFNIGATAGGPGGGGSLSTVNVTLHGSNDVPVIQGSNTTFADVALHGSTSGSFTFTDPDWFPDGQTVDFVPHNSSSHGSMTGGTDWSYTADFGPGTLVAGQHDIWDAIVKDHFGSVATHTFDFHLF
ncbi:MAG TPA: Ig-like domain-containing protein, partial [Xanthobacteraceae bacterium]|nr:Ig-like domain-containing protein [Xanthobacteraceae bacterium]